MGAARHTRSPERPASKHLTLGQAVIGGVAKVAGLTNGHDGEGATDLSDAAYFKTFSPQIKTPPAARRATSPTPPSAVVPAYLFSFPLQGVPKEVRRR